MDQKGEEVPHAGAAFILFLNHDLQAHIFNSVCVLHVCPHERVAQGQGSRWIRTKTRRLLLRSLSDTLPLHKRKKRRPLLGCIILRLILHGPQRCRSRVPSSWEFQKKRKREKRKYASPIQVRRALVLSLSLSLSNIISAVRMSNNLYPTTTTDTYPTGRIGRESENEPQIHTD